MKFTIEETERYTVLQFEDNSLNSVVAPDLKSKLLLLLNEGTGNIVLDMKDVDFVDSSGLSAILFGHRACNEGGGLLVVANPHAFVQRLIRISKLEDLLHIVESVQHGRDLIMKNELRKELEGNGVDE